MDLLCGGSPLLRLLFLLILVSERANGTGQQPRRQKREWILAPRTLMENHDYTHQDSIARIRSDKEEYESLKYSISGPGVDQEPLGRFTVNPNTGFVKVNAILDREEIAQYHLLGSAKFKNGTPAENDIELVIKVGDVNDCAPVVQTMQVGTVAEASARGAFVMKVIATDADDPTTDHAKISYSIQDESGMFTINRRTGVITVQKTTLDREVKDMYKVTVNAKDLGGIEGGKTGSGTVEIKLLDINDNVPTLEKEFYEGSVEENRVGVEVVRIKAVDLDMEFTENWLAMFEIISGNEAGYFEIITDSKTNEAVIKTVKALNYEEIKTLNLAVRVSNKAAYNFGSSTTITGSSSSKSYPIKVNVVNQKEGPRFDPSVKVVTVSEDRTSISLNQIIATYAAIDTDTGLIATNVRYAKLDDRDNWLTIDENTAEIRLNKLPDRESMYLINGTYYAKIIVTTKEVPSKTATGTVAIQVSDFNDHCPELTTRTTTMCYGDRVIYATAVDKDAFPNSAPFQFTWIQKSSKMNWRVEHLNETTVIMRDEAHLWPGKYEVVLEVKDQQGKACSEVQTISLMVCTCHEETRSCLSRSKTNVSFGAGGILLMLLGLLLLLLVPLLLLLCQCGNSAITFKPIPFEANSNLISYHTEGQGEDKAMPLIQVPGNVDGDVTQFGNINISGGKGNGGGWGISSGGGGMGGGGGGFGFGEYNYEEQVNVNNINNNYSQWQGATDLQGIYGGQEMEFNKIRTGAFNVNALPGGFLSEYYSNKSAELSQHIEENDGDLIYAEEGSGSPAGSIGCCSLLDNNDDLAFLDDLGPRFNTLAEICRGVTLVDNVEHALPVPPVKVPSVTQSHVHTHMETIRDRDRLNFSSLSSSNAASASSTTVQQERFTEKAHSSTSLPTVVPTQTLLIQQPTMYYAATPMYVVDPKPQVLLVSGGTQQTVSQVPNAGFTQGLLQVGGLQSSQGVVLVEEKAGLSGSTGFIPQGVSQANVSESSQVFVVENGSSGGTRRTHIEQGFVPAGQRSSEAALEVGGSGVQVKSFSVSSRGSAGSKENFALAATPKFQGSKKVVTTHKTVSLTERNFESSTTE